MTLPFAKEKERLFFPGEFYSLQALEAVREDFSEDIRGVVRRSGGYYLELKTDSQDRIGEILNAAFEYTRGA